MSKLFLPARIICDCVVTIWSIFEIAKNVKTLKKQAINSSNEK